jgi:hypothetical protein
MHRLHFTLTLAAAVVLFSTSAVHAQSTSQSTDSSVTSAAQAPIPRAIAAAKTIFLSNAGADSTLFPSPFSGTPDRGYNQLYAALAASHRFQIVNSPAQADLIVQIRLTADYIPYRPHNELGFADRQPLFRLVVYDRPTHYVLWAITQPVEFAVLQHSHDRNFDNAVNALARQFLDLASPSTPASASTP